MTPLPTTRALALFAGCFGALVIAAVFGTASAASAASGGLLMLAFAYAQTLPLARRLRGETIELAWWLDADASARRDRVVAGSPFALRCFLRHHGDHGVTLRRLELVSDAVTGLDEADSFRFVVPPRARADFSLRALCRGPGRAVVHGARAEVEGPLGLFTVRLYFPNRLRLTSLPVRTSTRSVVHTPLDARVVPRRSARTKRDEGTDIHELREHRPGDPFRHIAWKTSARVGRLVVRELEREELGSVEMILDAGPTMRDGRPGDRRLDRAIALALGIADESLRRGERVGLVTADRRVLERVDADSRPDQRERLVEAMLASLVCVDADRTVEDDVEVGRVVARYVRHQEGVDFLDPQAADGVHVEKLALHVAGRVRRYHDVRAETQAGRIVRRYAEHVGIPLQHRTDRDVAARSTGLVAALQSIAARRRAPSRVVVLTDGIDVDFVGALRAPWMHLRRHGHVLEVVLVSQPIPYARELGLGRDSPLAASFIEDDAARLRAVANGLRGLGVAAHLDLPAISRTDAA